MKKVFSTIAAALVALAFAGTVLAADAPKTEAAPMPAGHPPVAKEATKPAKKVKKAKAKKAVKKEEAKPAEAPAAAPAAK